MAAYKEHYSNGEWRKCVADDGECRVHEGDGGDDIPHIAAETKEELAVKREQATEQIMADEGFGTFGTVSKSAQYDYTDVHSYVDSVFDENMVEEDDDHITVFSTHGTDHITLSKEEFDFPDASSEAERQELMRDELARTLEDYDADDEMINYNDGGEGSYEYLQRAQQFETELQAKAREIRGLSPLPTQDTEPEDPNVSLDESTLPDDEEAVSEENLSKFLEGAGLEGPNSEVTEETEMVAEADDVVTGYHVSVEAPNNATIGLTAEPNMDMREFNEQAIDYLGSFSAEEEFDSLWSRKFGEHNGFTASQFAQKLEEDERYFHAVADKLHERSQNTPYQRDEQQFKTAAEQRAEYKDWMAAERGRDE